MHSAAEQRRRLAGLDRAALEAYQLEQFNRLLAEILPQNALYAAKLRGVSLPVASLSDVCALPATVKDELLPAAGSLQPRNLTYPADEYVRFHQTSGTRGKAMPVWDRPADWQWWIDTWQYVLDVADVRPGDRAFLAFSFGPFIGFWSAFDAVTARGALAVPAGGMSSAARLDLIARTESNVLFCTPTYALRLAEVAAEGNWNLAASTIRKIIVAGEPGGSIPALRARIESAWQAELFDHAGASEVGPWGYPDPAGRGLHVVESEFLAEFLAVETGAPAKSGELAHLVLTTLGRYGAPVIRYRTGDLVRPSWPAEGFVFLEGGVLGRADDMLIVRGVNVFPSAVGEILHGFPEVVEYRLTARKQGAMDTLRVEVEDRLDRPQRIADELQLRLGLSVDVHCVPVLSLPRFEGKSRRFVDERGGMTND